MTRRGALWQVLSVVGLLAVAAPASANEFDDFQQARQAYEALDYTTAADLFEHLVGGEVPSLTNIPLILESRKYLAASYLFLGKVELAEGQLEQLLREEPGYVLDPLAFPADLQAMFERVRAWLAAEEAEAKAAAAREAAQARERDHFDQARERRRMERLLELAKTERVEVVRSRWIALIPFGVGQFHNDHDSLGLVLAVSEGTLLAASVVSFLVHESLRDLPPISTEDQSDAEFADAAWRITNNISTGLFALVAITGIIDAQIRFKGSRSYDRERPLPPDLRGVELSVTPTPGGLSLSARF